MSYSVAKQNPKLSYLTLPDNYIYISHLGDDGEYLMLPSYPETIQDQMQSTFAQTSALSRSAPVFTYSNSGPRSIQVTLELHRDIMDDINIGVSNIKPEDRDDYVDTLIKKLQAIAVPKYNLTNKAVEPPVVAVRFGDEIFIKGVVSGAISVTYGKPILSNNKYARCTVAFSIYETDPYDATSVASNGSFRGLTRGMRKGMNYSEGE